MVYTPSFIVFFSIRYYIPVNWTPGSLQTNKERVRTKKVSQFSFKFRHWFSFWGDDPLGWFMDRLCPVVDADRASLTSGLPHSRVL